MRVRHPAEQYWHWWTFEQCDFRDRIDKMNEQILGRETERSIFSILPHVLADNMSQALVCVSLSQYQQTTNADISNPINFSVPNYRDQEYLLSLITTSICCGSEKALRPSRVTARHESRKRRRRREKRISFVSESTQLENMHDNNKDERRR